MTGNQFEYEATYLRAALEQLKTYLLSDEIFWNLGLRNVNESPPYPQMTLGNLLLSEAKLRGLEKNGAQAQAWEELAAQLAEQRREWQSAWAAKAKKEFGVRLRQWERSLDEISKELSRHASSFSGEVRVRAQLELLKKYLADESTGLLSELAMLDGRLKRVTLDGDFLWDEGFASGFPEESFWFLRRRIKGV